MLRRLVLLALVLLGAYVGTQAMAEVLPERGAALAERGLLVLFGILFAWISAGFWTGVMGAGVLLFGRGRSPLMRGLASQPLRPLDPAARTAIVMPICNEHVPTVFGGLAATVDSLISTGESENFDVYVLSDTSRSRHPRRRASRLERSRRAHRRRQRRPEPARCSVHYRWRQRRVKRKAGNVADFCRRWGAAYRYLVVLDADSVMTGECLTTLVRLMEAHGDAGIIQTAPRAVGHETLHARIQQFSARAYGPLFTAGMRFWQLGESHYWGHNAILRMAPFMAHCALAPLPGEGPLSGEVMSHDFVEAALMRRAGWKVWVADELDGSYEQVPPNLLAELQRDRRWCHGNLQNSRLMFEPRLHAVHRTAFLTGVLAYASSPLWLAFLLLSTLLFAQTAGSDPTYFREPYQLFPIWPTANVALMLTLFGLTAVLLLAPKVLALVALIVRGEARRFGGAARLVASAGDRVRSLAAAGAGAHALPQPVRARRADRLAPRLEVAAARRRLDALARGGRAPRRPHPAGDRLDRGDRRHQRGVPVVAVADPRRPAGGDPAFGATRSRVRIGRALAPSRPDADAGRMQRASRPARSAPCRGRESPHPWRRSAPRSPIAGCTQRVVAALPLRAALPPRPRPTPRSRASSARCATDRTRCPATTACALLSSRAALALLHREVAAGRAHPGWCDGRERRRDRPRADGADVALARRGRRSTRRTARARDQLALTRRSPFRVRSARPRRERAAARSMADDIATLRRILRTSRTIAVVGLSAEWHRPSYFAAKYMQEHGYRIMPVNPRYDEILGERCHATLATIEVPVDIVDVFRRTEDVMPIAEQAIAIGAKCLWQQIGVKNEAAAALAAAAGLDVVMDRCVKIEHARLFGGLNWAGVNTGVISARRPA